MKNECIDEEINKRMNEWITGKDETQDERYM